MHDMGVQDKKPCRGLHKCDDCILERLLLMLQVSDQLQFLLFAYCSERILSFYTVLSFCTNLQRTFK